MTAGRLHPTIVADRLAWIDRMLTKIHELPLDDLESFEADPHAPGAAESYLRRALEALLDLGRHAVRDLCRKLGDVERVRDALRTWIASRPDLLTEAE